MAESRSPFAAESCPTRIPRRSRLPLRGRDSERGQALILTSLCMVVVLVMSAVSIDVAQWYQKHHQAQVAADAAACSTENPISTACFS